MANPQRACQPANRERSAPPQPALLWGSGSAQQSGPVYRQSPGDFFEGSLRTSRAIAPCVIIICFFLLSMMDLGCVEAMRGVRGDLVEEIAHLDGLAQKCISFSVHKRSTKE